MKSRWDRRGSWHLSRSWRGAECSNVRSPPGLSAGDGFGHEGTEGLLAAEAEILGMTKAYAGQGVEPLRA